jgi:crotonobetainyl-CoA:carnitine CoA-transferase CaiB-like acyl-CoA transferase
MSRPLYDLKILDLTWALAGPFWTMLRAALGVDVNRKAIEADR